MTSEEVCATIKAELGEDFQVDWYFVPLRYHEVTEADLDIYDDVRLGEMMPIRQHWEISVQRGGKGSIAVVPDRDANWPASMPVRMATLFRETFNRAEVR